MHLKQVSNLDHENDVHDFWVLGYKELENNYVLEYD